VCTNALEKSALSSEDIGVGITRLVALKLDMVPLVVWGRLSFMNGLDTPHDRAPICTPCPIPMPQGVGCRPHANWCSSYSGF
jgi:hypothetical protein